MLLVSLALSVCGARFGRQAYEGQRLNASPSESLCLSSSPSSSAILNSTVLLYCARGRVQSVNPDVQYVKWFSELGLNIGG